jgi:hypothetical protein
MDSHVRIVRSFKKLKPIPEVPETNQRPHSISQISYHLRRILSFYRLWLLSPNYQHVSSPDTSLVIVKGTADPHGSRVRVRRVRVRVQIALPATFLMT